MEYGGRSHTEHNLVWLGIVLAVGLLLAFVLYTFWPNTLGMSVSVGAKTFYADIAENEADRTTGLSTFDKLTDDKALLMVYQDDAVWPVETKDATSAVDILWISKEKRIVYIARDARPSARATYKPGGNSRYVLMLPAGSVAKYGITAGQQVSFEHEV